MTSPLDALIQAAGLPWKDSYTFDKDGKTHRRAWLHNKDAEDIGGEEGFHPDDGHYIYIAANALPGLVDLLRQHIAACRARYGAKPGGCFVCDASRAALADLERRATELMEEPTDAD